VTQRRIGEIATVIIVIAGLLTIILWRVWIGLIVLLIAVVLRLWMRTSGGWES
jgi:hypothetical protein